MLGDLPRSFRMPFFNSEKMRNTRSFPLTYHHCGGNMCRKVRSCLPRALQDPIHFELSTINCELRPGHVCACEPDAPTHRPYLRAGQFSSEPRRSFGNANSPRMSAEADKSFGMRTYEKRPRKSFRMHTYKFIRLKAPWNEHLQKKGGGGCLVGTDRADA